MNLKQVEKFHRMKSQIPRLIMQTIDNSEIVHGANAMNRQMHAQHLRERTRDIDVFSKHPRQSAKETEKYLDAQFGFNAFDTSQGKHTETFKVKSLVTGQTFADFTQPEGKINYRVINGKKYRTLKDIKKHTKQTLRKGLATHRKAKDQDMLNRIKLNQGLNLW